MSVIGAKIVIVISFSNSLLRHINEHIMDALSENAAINKRIRLLRRCRFYGLAALVALKEILMTTVKLAAGCYAVHFVVLLMS